jgi:hypothetical protein
MNRLFGALNTKQLLKSGLRRVQQGMRILERTSDYRNELWEYVRIMGVNLFQIQFGTLVHERKA